VKSKDFDWRIQLKEGDQVDCCDKMGIWYPSTVLEARSKRTDGCRKILQVLIGYRNYHEEGRKIDDDM